MKARLGPGFLLWLTTVGHAQSLTLPTPPQQGAEWPAPADVPTNILSAANTLFAQGFPDPRGCEYREIEIVTSGVWEGRTNATTRGWVLPATTDASRHAIAWNGLIYPTVKVGDVADLRAEAERLAAARKTIRPFFPGDSTQAAGELRSVFPETAQATRVLLLLRAGETAAALTNFALDRPRGFSKSELIRRLRGENAAGSTNAPPSPQSAERPGAPSYDPYLQFSGDWAWALFDRALNAHSRGDVALALATVRTLGDVQPKIEAEAARRGFPRQSNYDSRRKEKEKPYLDFLEQLPQLLADLERREREGPRTSVLERGLTNIANQNERIQALIHDLDLVGTRQMSQLGGVIPTQDPMTALIAEGDPAVEPLLDCVQNDKRLTRSVNLGRRLDARTVLTVSGEAQNALRMILQASFNSPGEMSAYWQKYGRFKLPERWFEILEDDSAGAGRWVEAAGLIVQPTAAPASLRGEVLRGKTSPSIAELLARRALEISPANLAAYDLSAAGELGLRLAAWDTNAAKPVLKTLSERCRAGLEYSAPVPHAGPPPWGLLLAKLSVARAEHGDDAGFADYATWLKTTRPEQLDYSLAECLAPLCQFPTNAILRATADELFGNPNSTWGRLSWSRSGSFNPIESDLVRVPAFRRLLAQELENTSICGHTEWRAPNYATVTLTNQAHLTSGRTLDLPEHERPTAGAKSELRWCDWIAFSLANAKRIPPFNPFAAVEARDAVIASAKAMLAQPERF